MKVSYVINVLNGEPFIKYQIDSIYEFAHQIIIVEGAYKKFTHASTNGRSRDNTIDIIKNYNDYDHKITLITKDHLYPDRMEMCNECLEKATGDIIWQLDVDEFYLEMTHDYVRDLFESDPALDLISFNFRNYFINTNYYVCGLESIGLGDVNRVFRFNKGDKWISQRPPTLGTSTNEQKTIRHQIRGPELEAKGHIMHHATMFFHDQINDKFKYYSSMWSSIIRPELWLSNTWKNFNNKLNVGGITNHITYLEKNELSIPSSLQKLICHLENEIIENYTLKDDTEVKEFMESDAFPDYKEIAIRINNISELTTLTCVKTTLSLFQETFIKLDSYSGRFARKALLIKFLANMRSKICSEK